jgi:hypothetical protein
MSGAHPPRADTADVSSHKTSDETIVSISWKNLNFLVVMLSGKKLTSDQVELVMSLCEPKPAPAPETETETESETETEPKGVDTPTKGTLIKSVFPSPGDAGEYHPKKAGVRAPTFLCEDTGRKVNGKRVLAYKSTFPNMKACFTSILQVKPSYQQYYNMRVFAMSGDPVSGNQYAFTDRHDEGVFAKFYITDLPEHQAVALSEQVRASIKLP